MQRRRVSEEVFRYVKLYQQGDVYKRQGLDEFIRNRFEINKIFKVIDGSIFACEQEDFNEH